MVDFTQCSTPGSSVTGYIGNNLEGHNGSTLTGVNSVGAKVEITNQGEIQTRLVDQSKLLEILAGTLARLNDKLTPVITPKPMNTDAVTEKQVQENPNQYVLTHLISNNTHIQRLTTAVDYIINQVDL